MQRKIELDIIIPISLDLDWPEKESIIAEIREQHEKYGFTRFALACPSGGWRAVGYPPTEFFAERGAIFAEIKAALAPEGIDCGWWITATLKSGLDPAFTAITHPDGSTHGFSNCPLDPAFRARFSKNVALFAKIGKPSFIITEDDFSINAAASEYGCFCEHHMAEFSKREGKAYTRDELTAIFRSHTPESYALLRRFRELMRDSLVGMAEAMRQAVDVDSPEIPMGYMQAGNCDVDGDVTLAVCRALAGPKHTPFSRLFGTFYGGVTPQNIPSQMFHSIYCKQHIEGDFIFYHESDTFPHTRFFTSGRDMLAIMGAAYSMGFDGSTFQTQQLLDHAGEETAYGKMFAKERARLNALSHAAKKCTPKGIELLYDPFWSTVNWCSGKPWAKALSMHSVPWITTDSDVVCLDAGSASVLPDEEIRRYLAKPLVFLDANAAKALCNRGYSQYIGVSLGEPINELPENARLRFDLGAREVIREKFIDGDTGRNMPSAHMLASGNGKMLKTEIIDPACEIITDMYTYDKRYVTPSMTRYHNSLGGTVVVMSITLDGNYSQSLYNYRRQRLIHRLIAEHCDTLVFVREAPRVFTIMNDANSSADFAHLLTLINLSSDELCDAAIHLPPAWKNFREVLTLNREGQWIPADFTVTDDGITLGNEIDYLKPTYLMFK
ncbi:MAG: hypothetical protein J6C52_03295 [Clostridia bacterium]|nr:hypothetical protein [Clostridia bacterium]